MPLLLLGLILFLGTHSIRIVANDWRDQQVMQLGVLKWKALYSLPSLAGLLLIIWGFGQAAADPILLWSPPVGMRHLVMLLMVPAFILLVATYLPTSRIKTKFGFGHPMLLSVKLWAFAHLLANGTLAAVILFGSFLIWGIVDFAVCRRRDRREGIRSAGGSLKADLLVVLVGITAWAVFAFYLHQKLIGVSPLA